MKAHECGASSKEYFLSDTIIYGLIDPCTQQIRYVGKTVNPKNRLKSHISAAKSKRGSHLPVNRWMRKLLEQGMKPQMVILDSCSLWSWQEAEKWWIMFCRLNNIPILNITNGGESGFLGGTLSEEVRQKMSADRKGRKKPDSFPMKMSKSWKERDKASVALKVHQAKKPNKETGFYGVYFSKANKRWYPRLRKDGNVYVGKCSNDPEIAAKRYDVLAREHYGKDAVVNFKEDDEIV